MLNVGSWYRIVTIAVTTSDQSVKTLCEDELSDVGGLPSRGQAAQIILQSGTAFTLVDRLTGAELAVAANTPKSIPSIRAWDQLGIKAGSSINVTVEIFYDERP